MNRPVGNTGMIRTEDSRAVRVIISGGTALAAGFGTASLQAWTGGGWEFRWKTFMGFFIGAAVTLGYWKIIFHPSPHHRQKFFRLGATVLLALAGVGFFLYPVKFVQAALLPEIMAGLITALCALMGIGTLLFLAKCLFDGPSEKVDDPRL